MEGGGSPPAYPPAGPSVIALSFVAGGATLVVSLLCFRLWLGALPRSVCPSCGQATVSVTHALSAVTDAWIRRRWCAGCNWAGWGRHGPVLWRRNGPVAYVSGFRWGEDHLPADFGFRWAERAAAERVTPAHPSGFQWADRPGATPTGTENTAHRSGFRFQGSHCEVATTEDHPSGFRWSVNPRAGQPGIPLEELSGAPRRSTRRG